MILRDIAFKCSDHFFSVSYLIYKDWTDFICLKLTFFVAVVSTWHEEDGK
jgi:hypothetical protein